jgi:hypothetical protein
MEKLKLPIIKKPIPEPRALSMDEYLKFVTFNLKYCLDKRTGREWKKMLAVNSPFSMSLSPKEKPAEGRC